MNKTTITKNYNFQLQNNLYYQASATSTNHLFFKLEPHLLESNHFHDSIEIIYMVKGKAEAHIDLSSYVLKPGKICIVNPNQPHFYKKLTKEISAYVLVVGHSFSHHLRESNPNFSFTNFLDDSSKNETIINTILQWHNDSKTNFLLNCAYANRLFYHIIESYGLITKRYNVPNRLSVKIINYINQKYMENISLSKMAEDFGYSREHFSKIFHKEMGIHFNEYLNQIRLSHAISRICDTNNNNKITEIIFSCGYNNLTTFYRAYKKYLNNPTN